MIKPPILGEVLALVVVVFFVPALGTGSYAQTGKADGSATYTRNPSTPAQGRTVKTARELWRAGAEENGPIFGVVIQALTDDEGRVYLLDQQLNTVLVFGPDGRFLKTIAREGDGPGEIRQPNGMTMLPDGTIGISKAHSGQLVRLDRDGIPQTNVEARPPEDDGGGMVWLEGVGCRGGSLVFLCHRMSHATGRQKTLYYLAGFDWGGREKCRYFEKEMVDNFADFRINEVEYYFPRGRLWTIGPDGRVYLAPERNEYRVNVYAPDGKLERIIERNFEPVRRDRQEKKATRKAYEEWYATLSPKIELEDVEPAISRMMIDADSQLWVLSSAGVREQPDGIMATYDVFDSMGRFVRQVAVACAGDGRLDDLFFLGGNRLLMVLRALEATMALSGIPLVFDGEPAPMEIVCLEVLD
jgi:hypothetical protein